MMNVSEELVEALRMKIDALQLKNEALQIKIQALEMQNTMAGERFAAPAPARMPEMPRQAIPVTNGHATRAVETEPEVEIEEEPTEEAPRERRGRKPKGKATIIKRMQNPLNVALQDLLKDGNYNRATYRALTGILLCMYENGYATVTMLHEYIGGARVTVVRHTALLKRMGLLRYEGSRKKGQYVLTEKGEEFLNEVAEQAK